MKNGVYLKISHKGLELFEFPVMGNWNLKGIFSNQDFKRVQTAFCAQKSHIMVQPSMDGSIQEQKIHQCWIFKILPLVIVRKQYSATY